MCEELLSKYNWEIESKRSVDKLEDIWSFFKPKLVTDKKTIIIEHNDMDFNEPEELLDISYHISSLEHINGIFTDSQYCLELEQKLTLIPDVEVISVTRGGFIESHYIGICSITDFRKSIFKRLILGLFELGYCWYNPEIHEFIGIGTGVAIRFSEFYLPYDIHDENLIDK